jgi:hypothetical protein
MCLPETVELWMRRNSSLRLNMSVKSIPPGFRYPGQLLSSATSCSPRIRRSKLDVLTHLYSQLLCSFLFSRCCGPPKLGMALASVLRWAMLWVAFFLCFTSSALSTTLAEHASDQLLLRRKVPSADVPDWEDAIPLMRVHYHHLGKRDFHHELVEPSRNFSIDYQLGTLNSLSIRAFESDKEL